MERIPTTRAKSSALAQPRQEFVVDAVELAVGEHRHHILVVQVGTSRLTISSALAEYSAILPQLRSRLMIASRSNRSLSFRPCIRCMREMNTPSASESDSANSRWKMLRRVVLVRGSNSAHNRRRGYSWRIARIVSESLSDDARNRRARSPLPLHRALPCALDPVNVENPRWIRSRDTPSSSAQATTAAALCWLCSPGIGNS